MRRIVLAQSQQKLGFSTMRFKYPRTPHLPWSESVQDDDLIQEHSFIGKQVVVTRKMDGENFTGFNGGCHARSPDGRSHPSRDLAKAYWMNKSMFLTTGWRISAENLYAKHSIYYDDLASYLLGFGVWDENLVCLSWDDTVAVFQDLEMHTVEVLYRGIWNEKLIRSLWKDHDRERHEGYVVRLEDSFAFSEFSANVRKFVRRNHVQTDQHWLKGPITPNGLKKNID